MKSRALKSVLKLVQLKAEQSATVARQARVRFEQAKEFSDQVTAYTRDYVQEFSKSALQGEGAQMLQARSDFSARLHSTAQEQERQALQLQGQARVAVEHAYSQQARAKAMERFVKARDQQIRHEAERREDKELEDQIQARAGRPAP
jgi:flagellar biosynthesis chaperone FliJ